MNGLISHCYCLGFSQVPPALIHYSEVFFFLFQAVIKEQLQETQGLCEYALYVQGKTCISSLLTREYT
jgi:hypothetical protein